MEIKVIKNIDLFSQLEDKWNSLLQRCENRDILFSHQWYYCWANSFILDNELFVVTAKDSEKYHAILPLIKIKYKKKGITFKALKSITNDFSERFDILFAKPSSDIISQMLKKAFDASRSKILILEKLPENSLMLRYINDSCDLLGYHYIIKNQYENSLIRIEDNFEDYFNRLASKFKKNVRAAEKKTFQRGAIELARPKSQEDLDDILERGFKVEAQSWKGKVGSAIAQNEKVKNFYSRLAREYFKSGNLELFLLKNCEDDIAFLFCIGNYGCIKALKIGMNEKFRNIGPGMMISKKVLETMFLEKKYKLWDFGGGPARWKSDWSNETEKYYKVFIFKNSMLGKILYKFAKNYQQF